MAEFKHPHKFDETVYFAPVGNEWEQYCISPDGVVSRLRYETGDAPGYPLALTVYRPMEITEAWVDGQAQILIETWDENWHDDYDTEGEADSGTRAEDFKAILEVCRRMAKRSQPFHCEPTGDTLIVEVPDG